MSDNIKYPWLILIGIIVIFGIIVLGVILFKKFVLNKKNDDLIKKEEVKIDENKAINEELERILEPIEDEEIVEQMEQFNDKEKGK